MYLTESTEVDNESGTSVRTRTVGTSTDPSLLGIPNKKLRRPRKRYVSDSETDFDADTSDTVDSGEERRTNPGNQRKRTPWPQLVQRVVGNEKGHADA